MVHHSHDEMKNPGTARQGRCDKCKMTNEQNRICNLSLFTRHCDGAVSIEMVFFLLIFVVAFFGSVEMAREISVKHALDVGTYRATRYLSIVPSDQTTARNMIQTELDSNVLGGAGTVQMTVNMPRQSFQTIFSVTAQVNYQPVVPFIIFAPKTLQVSHSQSIEAYP